MDCSANGSGSPVVSVNTLEQIRALLYPSDSVSAWQPIKESRWVQASESDVTRRIAGGQARYALVLNRPAGFTVEQADSAPYAGPAYFDIDSRDIDTAIVQLRAFGANLAALGFDPNQARWYASGGKGFHCEIPPTGFLATPGFIAGLPAILRELAFSLVVDDLDMNVYSARLGRMWRAVNVKRESGRFKVPVTWAEIETMTPTTYAELTSSPRPYPDIVAPQFCPRLAVLFESARQRTASRRNAQPKANAELTKRFGRRLPPSLEALGRGELASPAGFQQIATQLAIMANAQGITEDALIATCRGLLRAHSSDGDRYNTPQKREAELRRMHRYMRSNTGYSVSVGGIRSILPRGLHAPDLRGL